MQAMDSSVAPGAPLVSVAITAFNSEKWLARAIDSVIEQQTSFPIEMVIGDDCSQDGTVAVAKSYQERYPNMVRILDRPQNIGIQRNYYETLEACRGKYIAWLDADDYWTDPEKLAIQSKLLEDDPSIAVCGHIVRWVTIDREFKRMHPSLAPGRYGVAEMIRRNFLPSPSVVFRNGIQRKLPEWYFDLKPVTDWPIWILAALTGDIVLLDRAMADYTLTPNSAFTGKGQLQGNMADARFYERVESILPPEFHRIARAEKGKRYEEISYLLRKQGDLAGSRKAALKAFRAPFLMDNFGSKTKTLLAALVRETQGRFRRGAAV
jgi:glycosyltransferase involved in cell wall biosynthesis